jgi:antitoxin component YwqK of YwqJK toxin-antitoxin module
MKYLVISLIIFSHGLTSCNFFTPQKPAKKETTVTNADGKFFQKRHFNNDPSAPVEWKISLKKTEDGETVREGITIRYSKSGKVYEKINYKNNKKEGKRLTYHSTGKVWKEQMYKNGKLEGICKRYDREGKLTAEYNYKAGLPGIGLKEYTNLGKEKEMPYLNIQKIDEVRTNARYRLKLSLVGNGIKRIKSVEYYEGELIEGKYYHKNLARAKALSSKTGEFNFGVPQGHVLNKTFNIVAVATTTSGLKLILQKKVSIAVRGV